MAKVLVLMKAVATVRVWEMMYNVVVQTVLLYGRNSWVVTDVMLKVLEGFHHILLNVFQG